MPTITTRGPDVAPRRYWRSTSATRRRRQAKSARPDAVALLDTLDRDVHGGRRVWSVVHVRRVGIVALARKLLILLCCGRVSSTGHLTTRAS